MIFFFTIFCLLSSFCFDKYTKNYYYIHTVFLRFLRFCFAIVCVVFQYIFFFSFSFAVRVQSTPAAALQILGYGFRFRFLKFIRLVLFIGSTKIVSHFLRNFVERDVFICSLHRASAFRRLLYSCHVLLAARHTHTNECTVPSRDRKMRNDKASDGRWRRKKKDVAVKVYANKLLSLLYFLLFLICFFFHERFGTSCNV